jgi:hypothetical protein
VFRFGPFFGLIAISGLAAGAAYADPLRDDAATQVTGRWVAASGERCDEVCGKSGSTAEHMLVYTSDGADIYLCRVRKPPANRFGNNYEDVCKVEDPAAAGGTLLESEYECLCVRRTD